MVQVEGKGSQPPGDVILKLTGPDMTLLLREANRRAEHRAYAQRNDQWGRGLMEATVIPNVGTISAAARPAFVGLCGEWAVQYLVNKRCGTNARLDLALLPGGDGGIDLEFFGLKTQVKTRGKDYGTFLVKHKTAAGRVVQHTADAFVFATFLGQSVHMHGYVPRDIVLAADVSMARVGSHLNYELQPEDLLPMTRLFDEIRSRKLWL